MVEIRLRKNNTICEFQLDLSDIKLPNDFATLQSLEKEVENSIVHLKKSNEEIKKFDPDGKDTDLLLALNENVFALSKKERRLEMIREKMTTLEGEGKLAAIEIQPNSTILNNRYGLKTEKEKTKQNIADLEDISNCSDIYSESVNDLNCEMSSEISINVETEMGNQQFTENSYFNKKASAGIKRKTDDYNTGNESDNLKNEKDENTSTECEKRKKTAVILNDTLDNTKEDGILL